MPRVTVIISTYNWSSVLPYSIASVRGQTFEDWELLVVGDGCTDDSAAVVERASEGAGERIRWINLPRNVGNQSGPNNEGLRQARGELVAYLGHDDLWLPHHLEVLVAAIDAGADVAHSVIRWVPPPGSAPHSHCFAAGNLVSPVSVMHRIGVTEQLGGWRDPREISGFPDADLWERMRAAGFLIRPVPRLSVIKIPAMMRQGIYKQRPCHEQAAWQRRIALEADLETSQFTAIIREAFEVIYQPPRGFWFDVKRWARDGLQLLSRVHLRLRPGVAVSPVEASRVLRGLDAKP